MFFISTTTFLSLFTSSFYNVFFFVFCPRIFLAHFSNIFPSCICWGHLKVCECARFLWSCYRMLLNIGVTNPLVFAQHSAGFFFVKFWRGGFFSFAMEMWQKFSLLLICMKYYQSGKREKLSCRHLSSLNDIIKL